MSNKNIPIKYTSRDFNSIKAELVEYAKRHYPNTHKDFSEASFGSLLLDTVAYVGDVLSFYLDYQANETFLSTAVEYDNILKLGEQVGYKAPLSNASHGEVTLYIIVPARGDGQGPDTAYLPVLLEGSTFSSAAAGIFTLMEDVNFAKPNNLAVVGDVDNTSGNPVSYAVRSYGRIMSGDLAQEDIIVGEFKRFYRTVVEARNITEILTVYDLEGHEYYEVPYLSQDVIFKPLVNRDPNTNQLAPRILKAQSVPRRFVTRNEDGRIILQFGYGSDSELKKAKVSHPGDVILDRYGHDYITDESFDPANMVSTDKFGVAPSDTTLRVTYRLNTSDSVNASVGTVNRPVNPLMEFPSTAVDTSKKNSVLRSLEATNEDIISGDTSPLTVRELRQRMSDVYASQNRAVTKQDYVNLIYRMPSKFGRIKRCNIVQDHDSFKRNLNLYILSEDLNGHLTTTNSIIKTNLKNWISEYKMINDTIDILDAFIVNFAVEFIAIGRLGTTKHDVLISCMETLNKHFFTKFDVGEPLYVTDLYHKLNMLEEVTDIADVKIVIKQAGIYSNITLDVEKYTSVDGRILYVPKDHILELKYPDIDIIGTIK